MDIGSHLYQCRRRDRSDFPLDNLSSLVVNLRQGQYYWNDRLGDIAGAQGLADAKALATDLKLTRPSGGGNWRRDVRRN